MKARPRVLRFWFGLGLALGAAAISGAAAAQGTADSAGAEGPRAGAAHPPERESHDGDQPQGATSDTDGVPVSASQAGTLPAAPRIGGVSKGAGEEEGAPLVGYYGPPWLPGMAEVRGPWVPGIDEVGLGLLSTLAPESSSWMADRGFSFFGWYMLSLQGNAKGGKQTGFASDTLFDFGMNVDFGKLANVPWLLFHVSGSLAAGGNLNEDVGSVMPVNAVFSGTSMRFFEAYFEANVLSDTLSVRAGRLTTGWEYGLDYDITTQHLNAAFRLNVFSLDGNDPNFSVIPYANWGARVRWTPNANVRLQGSFMNGYPRDFADRDKHGVDFAFKPQEGSFFILEGTYQWLATPAQRANSRGLPGRLIVGGYYDTGEFDDLDGSGGTSKHLGSAYVIARQKVWEPAPRSPLGIDFWTSLTAAGGGDIVSFPFYWNGGIAWFGPVPGRIGDSLTFGFAIADLNDALAPGNEVVLEWNYTIHITGFVDITPNVQYILNPGGTDTLPDAVLVGGLVYFTL